MRITWIRSLAAKPVQRFEVDGLSDVVVIAGPNGVGKTRLLSELLRALQVTAPSETSFGIESTSPTEAAEWGKSALDTSVQADLMLLHKTLQKSQARRNFQSKVLYYESDRKVTKIQPFPFQWEIKDPYEEKVPWTDSFRGLQTRFQDTQHAIFKKIQAQKTSIANAALALRRQGRDSMRLEFTDPLEPYREAFSKLLPGKSLSEPDLQKQRLLYHVGDEQRDINTLSSGEREVVNIAFDFILRQPSHSIVFFDEPELHLHPELAAKLIATLRTTGASNQFILCSHSPDLISSSLDDTVIFLKPPDESGANQAVSVRSAEEPTEVLRRLGHSIGVVSLGRRIVLIEGLEGSLDKKTYSRILSAGATTSQLVLLPSGGKDLLRSFEHAQENILRRTIWGVEFFMLADRDAVPTQSRAQDLEARSDGRFRALKHYHLENYFLHPEVLAKCFEQMEPAGSELRDPKRIDAKLRSIAKELIPYATSLVVAKSTRELVGSVDLMVKGVHAQSIESVQQGIEARALEELERCSHHLNAANLARLAREVAQNLEASITDPTQEWHSSFPGRPIFNQFASRSKIEASRLRSLYLEKAKDSDVDPFGEIVAIFESFASMAPHHR